MPVVSTVKMTSRQFLALGDDPPGVQLELVGGEIAVSPSPRPRHSFPFVELLTVLRLHVKKNDLGRIMAEVDTVLGPYDVRQPDISFIQKSRVHLIDLDDALNAAPDLCVEIVSPSSGTIDRVDKFEQYAAGGVANYWIVDPAKKTIEGYCLADGQYELTGQGHGAEIVTLAPFPDLQIALGDIWAPER